MKMHEVIIVMLGLACIFGYQIYRYLKREKKEQHVRDKIEAYKSAGQALIHQEEVPLNEKEAKFIHSSQVWMNAFMMLMIVLLAGGAACLLIFAVELNVLLILSGMFVITALVIYAIIRNQTKIRDKIAGGNKTIVRGIITRRYVHEDDSAPDKHYFVIDTVEISVKKDVYRMYQLGDAIEVHLFKPYYNMVLYTRKLEGAGLNS